MCGNLTEEAQGMRLTTAFLVSTEIRKGMGGEGMRLLQTASA